ncbi:hypothetical protein PAXRUDRAFT_147776, partial [Paxillus rubicundulus Ve08.2h10]
RWVKKFNFKMCCSNCNVCLIIDNFSGHTISYQPTNVQLEFFEPNMISFMQPCDAGIICCLKAIYCKNFCQHAINLDEGGEWEIYKLNILEGMMMAWHAWDQVLLEAIKNCWDHTQIQLCRSLSPDTLATWKVIQEFATMDMSLPEAEKQVQDILGTCYNDTDWRPAFKAVMDVKICLQVSVECSQGSRGYDMLGSICNI